MGVGGGGGRHGAAFLLTYHFPFSEGRGLWKKPGLDPRSLSIGVWLWDVPPPSLELWFLLPACPCRANVIDEEALGKWLCWSWENLSWPAGQADLGSFPVLSLCDLGQVA